MVYLTRCSGWYCDHSAALCDLCQHCGRMLCFQCFYSPKHLKHDPQFTRKPASRANWEFAQRLRSAQRRAG